MANRLLEKYVQVVRMDGINTNKNATFGVNGGTPTVTFNGPVVATSTFSQQGALTVTSTSSSSLAVGPNGATNPAFKVDSSTASAAAGLNVVGAVAAGTVSLVVISSGSNAGLRINALGTGTLSLGSISTGDVYIGRGPKNLPVFGATLTTLSSQNITPTAAQLRGGYVEHVTVTAGGTATLPTGTNLSAALVGAATGDSFETVYINSGNQTGTITGATGSTVIGTAAVAAGKNANLRFVCTGTNTWNVYVNVSA